MVRAARAAIGPVKTAYGAKGSSRTEPLRMGDAWAMLPCIGTPALLRAMWSLPKARSTSARASMIDLLQRHVRPHRHDALVRARPDVRRLLDRIFLDVGHDHVGACLGERRRDAQPDAGSDASDGCRRERPFATVLTPIGSYKIGIRDSVRSRRGCYDWELRMFGSSDCECPAPW